jgi:chorismate-pyruvate lyase
LAANDSATVALGQWCDARRIAEPSVIRALADRTAQSAASPAIRGTLGVSESDTVVYRHVRLACGSAVLSIAHNWYVPARLTPEMNHTLESSETPFGKVVAPLGFMRERLAAQRGKMAECPSGTVLSHRAVLKLADGRAISLVVECYTRANIRGAD